MQLKQTLRYIMLSCVLLLSVAVLLINVQAQAPQKAQIVFQSWRDGNYEIYVMDINRKTPRKLTNNPAHDVQPDWFDPAFAPVSPAGKLRGRWGEIRRGR